MAEAPRNAPIGQKVEWTDFAYPTPAFGLTERIQKIAGSIFLGCSVCSGLGTAAVAIALTATPIVVVSSFAGLALLSVALAATGIFFLCKSPPENDPDILRQQASDAGRDIEANQLGYDAIHQKYGQMIASQTINVAGIKGMIHQDAQQLSFAAFIAKHGTRHVFGIVDADTKALLRTKYFEHVSQSGSRLLDLFASREARAFAVGIEEIAPLIVRREVAATDSYATFIEHNGHDILPYITDEADKEKLSGLFLAHLPQLREVLGPSNQVHERFRRECASLPVFEAVRDYAFEEEKRKFTSGALDYRRFRERNDLALIKRCEPAFLEKLRHAFLCMPYDLAKTDHYQEDRDMLSIDTQELDCIHIDHMNEIAKGMTYLGTNGFKAVFGTELLQKNWIIHDNIQKFRKELYDHLIGQPLREMAHFAQEMQWFGLTRDEIMRQRFETLRLQEIMRVEREAFFANAMRLFPREELVLRFLKQYNGVRSLLRHCHEAFELQMVLPQDAPNGQKSISARLADEIAELNHIEEIESLDIIFKANLLPQDNPTLKLLTIDFIRANTVGLLQGEQHPIMDLLNRHDRVPPVAEKALAQASHKVVEEKNRHEQRLSEISRVHAQSVRTLQVRKLEAIEKKTNESGVGALLLQLANCQKAHERAAALYGKCSRELGTFEEQLKEARKNHTRLLEVYGQLNNEIPRLQIEVQREASIQLALREAEERLRTVDQQIQFAKAADAPEINRLKAKLQILQRIADLERDIPKELHRQKPVTGLFAAFANLSPNNFEQMQRELEELKAKITYVNSQEILLQLEQVKQTLESINTRNVRLVQSLGREGQATTLRTLQNRLSCLQEAKQQLRLSLDRLQKVTSELEQIKKMLVHLPKEITRVAEELGQAEIAQQQAKRSHDSMQQQYDGQNRRLQEQIDHENRRYREEEAIVTRTFERDRASENRLHEQTLEKIYADFREVISK